MNEDDDIVDDFDQINGEPDTSHLVLAKFDKVNVSHNLAWFLFECSHTKLSVIGQLTRMKNIWKCMLRNGIMHINSRNILFNRVGARGANANFFFFLSLLLLDALILSGQVLLLL